MPSPDRESPATAERALVLLANGIGDYLLCLPAVRALHALFPGRLSLLSPPGVAQTFYADLPWQRLHEVEMKMLGPDEGRILDVPYLVDAVGPCDVFLSLNFWHNHYIDELVEGLSPSCSLGYGVQADTDPPQGPPCHAADRAFAVPLELDPSLRIDDFSQPPFISARDESQARELLAVLPRGFRLLVVHPDTSAEKVYPPSSLRRVLERFLENHPDFLALLVGSDDLGLEATAGGRILSLSGLPVPLHISIVGAASLFLGVDSAFLHAADFHRVPGVALFGPTDPDRWGFRFGPGLSLLGTDGVTAAIGEDAILEALESQLSTAPAGVDRPNGS